MIAPRIRRLAAAAVFGLSVALGASAPAVAEDLAWEIDRDASAVLFVFTQTGEAVEGRFADWSADLAFDPDRPETNRVAVAIRTDSLDTGSESRDQTARSADFFDVATFPEARFESAEMVPDGDGWTARGTLSIRDVSLPVALPFRLEIGPDPDAADTVIGYADGAVTVDRRDYGLGRGDWVATAVVGAEVVIRIKVVARRPSGA